MTPTSIREITGKEMLEIMYQLNAYAFEPSPPLVDKGESEEALRERQGVTCFALFEDGEPVANVASTQMSQQVRGKVYGMSGIWGVSTHPGARRKGYSRRLLARLLSANRQAGRPLSCLYPFRESFYEMLGYAAFPQPRMAKFNPSVLAPLVKENLGGEVERMLIGDGYEMYRDYLFKLQPRLHGMALFDYGEKARAQKKNQWWLAFAKSAGEMVGVMLYELRGERVTEFKMRAIRFYYETSRGKYLLLQWIARHIDQANQVEIWLPPFEQPGTWLADIRPALEPVFFAPMGRVVDVAGIGGMQVGPGRFCARITDSLCPWNEGVWDFETVDGLLQISPADTPDCDLGVQALAALIYGIHDPGDFAFRGWGTPSPEIQKVLRAMFPPMIPYLHEMF
jgi:predicted acetyltransferase